MTHRHHRMSIEKETHPVTCREIASPPDLIVTIKQFTPLIPGGHAATAHRLRRAFAANRTASSRGDSSDCFNAISMIWSWMSGAMRSTPSSVRRADLAALRGRPRGNGHTNGRRSGAGCPTGRVCAALANATAQDLLREAGALKECVKAAHSPNMIQVSAPIRTRIPSSSIPKMSWHERRELSSRSGASSSSSSSSSVIAGRLTR